MPCASKSAKALLSRVAVCSAALGLAFTVHGQTPPQQPGQTTSAAAAAADIDALLKKASEQMHVTAQFKDAEASATRALELSRQSGDRVRTMKSLHALASVAFYVSRYPQALDLERESVGLARELGDKRSLSVALNGEASILRALGRFGDAAADFTESSAIARDLGDLPMQWTIARNVGVLYLEMGDTQRAEAPLRDALRIAGELGADRWKSQVPDGGAVARAASLETIGNWEIARERYAAAATDLEQALAVAPEVPALTAEILSNLATTRERLGAPLAAIDLLEKAATLWAASGAPPHPIMASDLASARESAGQLEAARTGQQRALALVHDSGGNPQYEWLIESRLAHVERALGNSEDAVAHYLSAARAIDVLRLGALRTETGRAFTVASRRRVYEEGADLLHELHRDAEALEFAERGRARAFLDLLAEARSGGSSGAESDAAFQEMRAPQPVGLAELRSQLLDGHTALVEYALGEHRSLAWVATADTVRTFELPGRRDVDKLTTAYLAALTRPVATLTLRSSLAEIERTGRALSTALVTPLASALHDATRLIVVPDGTLAYVPFETLVTSPARPASGRPAYLIEQTAVVYAPSASALIAVRTMAPPAPPARTLLAFGDPLNPPAVGGDTPARLPYARDEVLAISRLFPSSATHLYLGAEAREETIKSIALSDYRYVHLASHGIFDEARPERSGILFSRPAGSSEDGVLDVAEIARLRLNADLVTLSACSTGLGNLMTGEGVLGLTRAMFYAGVRNVAVSLWNVNDSATAALMTSLYRHLQRGLPPGEALRQAKLEFIRGSQTLWQHPYFWGAFVIQGEGR